MLVLLVLPLVAMLGLMSVGAATGAGMVSNMGGIMNGSAGSMGDEQRDDDVDLVAMVLVTAAAFLIVLLVRDTTRGVAG